jgi:FMN phosphatase YigB (HAD superfamily)
MDTIHSPMRRRDPLAPALEPREAGVDLSSSGPESGMPTTTAESAPAAPLVADAVLRANDPRAGVSQDLDSDPRLAELERLIDSGDFDLLSLDVFDTLVWRMVPTPADAFYRLAAALRSRGTLRRSSSVESFVRERTAAEKRARKFSRAGEVTLAEIYAEFPSGYLAGLSPSALPDLEVEIERELVRVRPEMNALIERARTRGLKTALVSDTYFDRRQIKRLAPVEVDFVLVSSEHGVSKHGGLHRVLIEASGVDPERILHVGDSYAADVEGPALFNVPRYWLRKFPDEYRDVVESELPATSGARSPYVREHDRGVTALRGRTQFECDDPYERWGAGILGPVVAGFGDWVIERCREESIGQVLCLMREGRLLKQVLDRAGANLDTHELFVSRLVARKASIFDASEEELRQFVFRPSQFDRTRVLAQLGLDPGDAGEPPSGGDRSADEALLELVRRIARDPRCRRRIVEESARARAGLLRHLQAVWNGTPPRRVAIVDLGYRGTIQECLQKIFDRERIGVSTHGLYVVTGGKVHLAQAAGCPIEGWLAENGHPISVAHTFMRSPEIVEQSLMADTGTTLGHADDGTPILDVNHVPAEQRGRIAAIQRGVLRYATRWAEHQKAHDVAPGVGLGPLYRAITVRSVARPLPIELELFAGFRHDENFGSGATRTLTEVTGLHEWEKSHMSAHQLASLPSARVHWPFGFAHQLSATMGDAVAHIYLRSAAPETFDSAHAPRCFTFLWDAGGGFDASNTSLQEFRINGRGRVWHRVSLSLASETHRHYGFMLGAPGELVTLTGIRVRVRPRHGEDRIVEHRPETVESLGYRRISDKLLLVEESPALLSIPAPDLERFTGTVEIDVFFALQPEA